MLGEQSSELNSDLEDSLKLRLTKRKKIVQSLFNVLDIKHETLPTSLRNAAQCLKRLGIIEVDRANIVSACVKLSLEQSFEADYARQLELPISILEILVSDTSKKLQQIQRDLNHNENALHTIMAQLNGNENARDDQEINRINQLISDPMNDNLQPHIKVMRLYNELMSKKKAKQEIESYISKFGGLPPDLNLAKKMIEDAKQKLKNINNEMEKTFAPLDTSFSP